MYVHVTVPPEVKLINYKQSQTIGRETMLQCNVSASPLGVHGWRFGKREFDQPSGENYRTEMFKDDKMRCHIFIDIHSSEIILLKRGFYNRMLVA